MTALSHLFDKNRAWAREMEAQKPGFFQELSVQQSPEYLWIGCSDSRVPANQITGLMPGEVFVHRNIANVVVHTDINCLSVIEFAVSVLKVKHIMVVGHYGCSGVRAAMDDVKVGIATNWLRNIQDVRNKHTARLEAIESPERRAERLCELNAIEQAVNVCHTTIVTDAWARGQELTVHGWVYGLTDGVLRDMKSTISRSADIVPIYEAALERL